MKILITGAAGFLGSAMVETAIERGHEVRAMIRPGGSSPAWPRSPAGIVKCDLSDPHAQLAEAVEGLEAVIHCAAATSEAAGDPARSRAINVEGMSRLIDAARKAGSRRWIQISSMSAHPGSTSLYGTSKRASDDLLRQAGDSLDWTILRPSLIYGPGTKGLAARMVDVMRKLPIVPVVGSGRELLRPIYVEDVARAAINALEIKESAGNSYMLGGADEVTFNDFMAQLSKASGVSRPSIHLPVWMCYWIARVLSLISKNPPLTVDNVLGVKEMQRVEQAGAERDLKYEPIGLAEGLRRSFP